VVLACVFVLLGVAQLCRGLQRAHAPSGLEVVNQYALREGANFVMPEQIGEWRRVEKEAPNLQKIETQGVYSQSWHYQKANQTVAVALDYPFLGYHDVFICYTGKGWTVTQSDSIAARSSKSLVPYVHARMQDGLGLYGTLWFSTVDERRCPRQKRLRLKSSSSKLACCFGANFRRESPRQNEAFTQAQNLAQNAPTTAAVV
jgi:hypothetical protein